VAPRSQPILPKSRYVLARKVSQHNGVIPCDSSRSAILVGTVGTIMLGIPPVFDKTIDGYHYLVALSLVSIRHASGT
jgi:hypothetical protein